MSRRDGEGGGKEKGGRKGPINGQRGRVPPTARSPSVPVEPLSLWGRVAPSLVSLLPLLVKRGLASLMTLPRCPCGGVCAPLRKSGAHLCDPMHGL